MTETARDFIHGFNCSFLGDDESCGKPAPWVPAEDQGDDGKMSAAWDGKAWCDEHRPDATPEITNPKDLAGMRKAPLRLVPPVATIRMAEVLAHGAAKYGPWNWRDESIHLCLYLEAALRHIAAVQDGEDLDADSGQPHIAHVAACMAVLMDAEAIGGLVDDRPLKPGGAARLLEEAKS